MEIGNVIIMDATLSGHPIFATDENYRVQVNEIIQGDSRRLSNYSITSCL